MHFSGDKLDCLQSCFREPADRFPWSLRDPSHLREAGLVGRGSVRAGDETSSRGQCLASQEALMRDACLAHRSGLPVLECVANCALPTAHSSTWVELNRQ